MNKFLTWDDWVVQYKMQELRHKSVPARRVANRDALKVAYEITHLQFLTRFEEAKVLLKEHAIEHVVDDKAEKETQKFFKSQLLVQGETSFEGVKPIAEVSKVAMAAPDKMFVQRIYVDREDREKAKEMLKELENGRGGMT